ncbi:MAG: hypothetical protein IIC64_05660 [SAR324 cluster bacterium]|nr:hypothetical protein [SAR324 cluster bacterium]
MNFAAKFSRWVFPVSETSLLTRTALPLVFNIHFPCPPLFSVPNRENFREKPKEINGFYAALPRRISGAGRGWTGLWEGNFFHEEA